MKTCLIRQPAGIGDIFFTQKIAKLLIKTKKYKKVIWPVKPQYLYIREYIDYPNIVYIDESSDFEFKDVYMSGINVLYESDNLLYIPLQHADQTYRIPDIRAHGYMKYKMCNDLSHDDWCYFLNIKRNKSREKKLIDKLNINLDDKFNLINKHYGSPPDFKSCENLIPSNSYKNIYMKIYDDIHIFDWLALAEYAEEIHTMETSLCFLLEYLNIKNVNVYSKYTCNDPQSTDNFSYIKNNYCSSWKYIG